MVSIHKWLKLQIQSARASKELHVNSVNEKILHDSVKDTRAAVQKTSERAGSKSHIQARVRGEAHRHSEALDMVTWTRLVSMRWQCAIQDPNLGVIRSFIIYKQVQCVARQQLPTSFSWLFFSTHQCVLLPPI